jgi:6-phosphogluconate dehydrogenase
MSHNIGVYGMAVMGANVALNIAEKLKGTGSGSVAVCNRSPGKVDEVVARAKAEGELPLFGYKDPAEFVASLNKPRAVIILVQAGKPVDDTIAALATYMEPGDILIDGGNEWYPNTLRRGAELGPKGLLFMGMGVSGGEEGARNGPALMPGGPREAYDAVKDILELIAAKTDTGACVTYIGELGSGNYVKMIHNGIEYGDMQLIAEAYDILKNIGGLTNEELQKTFADWNAGELDSFLIEITATIFGKKDADGGFVVDKILDKTGMKGTGRWTIQEAAERSIAAPTMASALDTRYLSGLKEERVAAQKVLTGPTDLPKVDKTQLIDDVRQALYAAKICSYAQGMNLIREASKQLGWVVNLGECARIWKGGCIIRAKFLDRIKRAYDRNPDIASLLVDPEFAEEINTRQPSWRRIVALCAATGIACPSFSSSLGYLDQYRRARLPANLTQAQRDFFGAHGYERVDKTGSFHTEWSKPEADTGVASKAGH